MIQIKGFAVALNRIDASAHVILAAIAMGPDRSGPISPLLPDARVRARWAALTALTVSALFGIPLEQTTGLVTGLLDISGPGCAAPGFGTS